ncbi:hypothetical protein J4Q44_G00361090 [Coregonus suidteri]|uniref:J domain-containing protein n=1 Tax=Coregonus suidteri TaxID=861788 RepID=A0AAN8KLM2_9TELE
MNGDGSVVRHRSHGDEARSSPGDSATYSSKPYTSDQLDAVKKIKSCKDYYEIPGVEKDVGEEDLKKSHRKLALKFHPDLKIRLQEPQRHFKPLAMQMLC